MNTELVMAVAFKTKTGKQGQWQEVDVGVEVKTTFALTKISYNQWQR